MTIRLRVLDDGAWISVNDTRRVRVSELWRVRALDFCECALTDLLVENFQSVSTDGAKICVSVYGECIRCGTDGTLQWLPVGRVIDGEFYNQALDSIRIS
jgi:hypothetical protein